MDNIQGHHLELRRHGDGKMQLGAAHAVGVHELPRPLAGDHLNRPPGGSCGSGAISRGSAARHLQGLLGATHPLFAAKGGEGGIHAGGVPGDHHHHYQGNQGPDDLQAGVALDRIAVVQVVLVGAVEQQRPEDHLHTAQEKKRADRGLQGEQAIDVGGGGGGGHGQPTGHLRLHPQAGQQVDGQGNGHQQGGHGRASRRFWPAASSWSAVTCTPNSAASSAPRVPCRPSRPNSSRPASRYSHCTWRPMSRRQRKRW